MPCHPSVGSGGKHDLGAAQQRRVDAGDVLEQQRQRQHRQVTIDRQVGQARSDRAGGVDKPAALERQAPFGLPVLPDVNEIFAGALRQADGAHRCASSA